jgi:hypothetical protein
MWHLHDIISERTSGWCKESDQSESSPLEGQNRIMINP